MADLFSNKSASAAATAYDASAIEVLEGLEPVRRRPGMYIGGTDDRAFHHLASEILDNAMDEAVAGHADRIEMTVSTDGSVTVRDNGRGIPVDNHPKYPGKSALEVIFTTLHSGGKFSGKAYETSGGLHGVGSAVVNALSEWMWVEVARDKTLYRQEFSRGLPTSALENKGVVNNRRGTTVCFKPDPEIFADRTFKPSWLYQLARSKAYLFRGVEIRWKCDEALLGADGKVPAEDNIHFPNGLLDYLNTALENTSTVTPLPFHGQAQLPENAGKVEFAVAWPEAGEGFTHSYCNTIPTPQGGTHEAGLRSALARGLRQYAEMTGNKKASIITADDVMGGAAILLSVFIRDPLFQGQTKEKLASQEATRWVDTAVKDHFDHWLSSDLQSANMLLETILDRAEERQRRKEDKSLARKTATRRLRLPGKLSDCSRTDAEGTEIFIVEGDSAGGSAKQARNRETQAILPLRGKILNVVSATADKIRGNQEIQDLILALGCGVGKDLKLENLRYERIVIMTDADVDGAHISSLLMTFFYTQMRPLIENSHLYLAMPPLYRLSGGGKTAYARDDNHRQELLTTLFKGKKVEVSRFKGLGEMQASQLKETTMDPRTRTMVRITIPKVETMLGISDELPSPATNRAALEDLIDQLMGKNAEARFNFIQQNAAFVDNIDI